MESMTFVSMNQIKNTSEKEKMRFTFKEGERLKSRKVIGRLFKEGLSHGAYPLRLVWLELEDGEGVYPVQFTVTAPKRNFKSAVARNRLKRKVKEAWRLNKHWLYAQLSEKEKRFAFMVIYTGKEEFEYDKIEASLRKLNRIFMAKTFPKEKKTGLKKEGRSTNESDH